MWLLLTFIAKIEKQYILQSPPLNGMTCHIEFTKLSNITFEDSNSVDDFLFLYTIAWSEITSIVEIIQTLDLSFFFR